MRQTQRGATIGEAFVSAKQTCSRLALACGLALACAAPAYAQTAAKRKPPANPWGELFNKLTDKPTNAKKSPKSAKKAPPSAAAKIASAPPAIPAPRPAPKADVPPPASVTAVAAVPPAVAAPAHPPAHAVEKTVVAAAPKAPVPADKALLLSAEPVKMAKDAWAPQTRVAMFAAEPSYEAAVFPALGSRLAAVAPIELRTPPAVAATVPPPAAIDVPLPRPAPPEGEVKIASLPTPEPPEPEEACINLLAAGVESTPAEALSGDGECGAKFPVKVVAFRTDEGRVALEPPAVMRCGMARAVAKWVKENVSPTAKAKLGSELRSIRNASSFVCRPRNGVAGAKMSEHGRANALDISAFVLADGKVVTVGSEGGETFSAFMGEVRTAACVYVHTVLGPGSDASHADHLHIDMAQRGRNGDARFCQ
jgi:hypothetical protein